MLKHVVKHNNRKAALLYRQVPNEDHMCLLVYSDLLPRMIHDEIMKVLESPVVIKGQKLREQEPRERVVISAFTATLPVCIGIIRNITGF